MQLLFYFCRPICLSYHSDRWGNGPHIESATCQLFIFPICLDNILFISLFNFSYSPLTCYYYYLPFAPFYIKDFVIVYNAFLRVCFHKHNPEVAESRTQTVYSTLPYDADLAGTYPLSCLGFRWIENIFLFVLKIFSLKDNSKQTKTWYYYELFFKIRNVWYTSLFIVMLVFSKNIIF